MAVRHPLLAIIGPTASGKSALALEVARRTGGEILSLDSMQVYRGMDIGTAKPTAAEQAIAVHHLIDVVDPTEAFTVARFIDLAERAIAGAAERGVPLIASGGTPLYYKALFEGLFDAPVADAALRDRLRLLGNDQLAARLAAVDPAAAARIHRNDTRRLIRALEVHELTGKPITALQTDWGARHRHPAVWIGLRWEPLALNRRINARVKAMIDAGWVQETRELLLKHGRLSATAAEATGYQELIDHVENGVPLEEAIERIKIATRQLARRQMKWFRRWPQLHWIPGDQPLEDLVTATLERWMA